MKARVKFIAIAGILPLFVGALIGMSMESSDAQLLKPTHPDVKRLSPKSFGSATSGIVCGDRLCSEAPADVTPSMVDVTPAIDDATPAYDVEEDQPIISIDNYDETTPTAKLIDIRKYKPSTNKADAVTFIVTYSVTAGTERLENIHVHVSSDMGHDGDTYTISSLDALKSSVNTVRIKALDPDSIDGGIVSYTVAPPTYDPRDPKLGQ